MFRKSAFWIGLIIVAALAAGAYAYYTHVYEATGETVEPTIATAEVRRGDLVVSVDGSGTLVPSAEADLGFETGGYLAEIMVEVGDRVEAGDVLAMLETDDLELALLEADIRLRLAQLNQDDTLEEPGEAEVADATASVQSAEDALAVAQTLYRSNENSNLDAAVRARQIVFQQAVAQYWEVEQSFNRGGASEEKLAAAWDEWASAEAAMNDALREANMEQLEALNLVQQAENRVVQAEERLTLVQTGPTTDTILRAELNLAQAQLALDDARDNLEAAELRAPYGGTVVAVQAVPGERVGTAPILTLADLDQPTLKFWVEEQDMSGVGVGNRVVITFEAFPDDTFDGEIVRVDPALVSVGQTLAVQAWAIVDVTSQTTNLPGGMNAEVEVISAESRDTVLVPLQALRELGPNRHAVFVVNSDDEMELRPVEVGLRDFVNAEIRSGLEPGETVSLGEAQTSEVAVPDEMPPGPGGAMGGAGRLFGGR